MAVTKVMSRLIDNISFASIKSLPGSRNWVATLHHTEYLKKQLCSFQEASVFKPPPVRAGAYRPGDIKSAVSISISESINSIVTEFYNTSSGNFNYFQSPQQERG